ncbi:MAG: hypothetical protein COA41_11320 [Sphingopyxis sp.]|nr:MAG: hypothetical protein COA41_11320 [Sphingopyxis sp.]
MYLDKQAEFSDAQAVTSTAISTNVMDLFAGTRSDAVNNTLRDIGTGQDVYLVVITQTAATDTSSDATLAITLESDSVAGLSASPTVHFTTGALAFAAFSPAGTVLASAKLPAGNYERYLGVRYTVASGPLTAGAFDAFLTTDVDAWRAYAKNYV